MSIKQNYTHVFVVKVKYVLLSLRGFTEYIVFLSNIMAVALLGLGLSSESFPLLPDMTNISKNVLVIQGVVTMAAIVGVLLNALNATGINSTQ